MPPQMKISNAVIPQMTPSKWRFMGGPIVVRCYTFSGFLQWLTIQLGVLILKTKQNKKKQLLTKSLIGLDCNDKW